MRLPLRRATLAAAVASAMAFSTAHAEATELPVATDQPYPGTLALHVDLSDASKHLYHVRETIPVSAGHAILYYPKWIPGVHAPSGPLANVAGFVVTANGKRIPWRRDLKEMYAFHVDVPDGVDKLDLAFEYLAPATPNYVPLSFNEVAFYPAGHYTSRITIEPSVTLPAGWKYASALETASQSGNEVRFKPVSFENLVDSPLMTGKYFNRIDLAPGQDTPVHLDIAGDTAAGVKATDEQIAKQRALVVQANKLFGAHHYGHYDFLLVVSDHTGHFGLEHHQSSDDRLYANFFTDPDVNVAAGTLLPHEYIHSWNGKFRRPKGQDVLNFNQPLQNDLLWVYEGQTTYYGEVLAARSGLMKAASIKDIIASTAARYGIQKGREWRSVQDTTYDPIINARRPIPWSNYQRSEDYYTEGMLIWLDVDTKIRELSGDKRSLDDFSSKFFGVEDGRVNALHYTFEDVVKVLNSVQPHDWATFLRTRIEDLGPVPMDGIARAGYKLVFAEKQTDFLKAAEDRSKSADFTYSLGFNVGSEGKIESIQWEGVGFKAGLSGSTTLLAVNGRAYKAELLRKAITEAKTSKKPIELLVKHGQQYSTVALAYYEGLKYPRLERIEGTPDRLEAILSPRQ